MAGFFSGFKALLTQHHQKVRTRQFLEASMKASALLAIADGDLSFAELMARDFVLDRVKELQVFDPNEAAEIFRQTTQELKNSPDIAKEKILTAVTKLSGDLDLAPLLIRICITIAKADYDFSEPESEVIAELSEVLGLKVEDVLLQITNEQ